MWGVVAVGLIVGVWIRTSFVVWVLTVLCTFGVMETIGVLNVSRRLPPLTQVIVEYVPRWLAFSVIYFSTGMAAATWFHVRWRLRLALLVGLLGWFTTHFDTAFDHKLMARENIKYAWYAKRFGLKSVSARMTARAEFRAQQDSQ
jgi:hypothetical protein